MRVKTIIIKAGHIKWWASRGKRIPGDANCHPSAPLPKTLINLPNPTSPLHAHQSQTTVLPQRREDKKAEEVKKPRLRREKEALQKLFFSLSLSLSLSLSISLWESRKH
eukprot:TRINITY_DN46021_c0_g1_i2.p1 TRINITY_DN46021_c0_g1~~TRINITY_DN46021_c0_g1_i2.p1  ORF type:complete len:109 (-),score=24.63 TRINITY_DN46021_c0_g1_i2:678-1004(-)